MSLRGKPERNIFYKKRSVIILKEAKNGIKLKGSNYMVKAMVLFIIFLLVILEGVLVKRGKPSDLAFEQSSAELSYLSQNKELEASSSPNNLSSNRNDNTNNDKDTNLDTDLNKETQKGDSDLKSTVPMIRSVKTLESQFMEHEGIKRNSVGIEVTTSPKVKIKVTTSPKAKIKVTQTPTHIPTKTMNITVAPKKTPPVLLSQKRVSKVTIEDDRKPSEKQKEDKKTKIEEGIFDRVESYKDGIYAQDCSWVYIMSVGGTMKKSIIINKDMPDTLQKGQKIRINSILSPYSDNLEVIVSLEKIN